MLEKYHKQTKSKRLKNKYKKLNESLSLNLNIHDEFDLIKLSIYEKGITQKQYFENQFESVRNDCFDMWDYLSFYEKNDLILLETNKDVDSLHSFEQEDVKIYIPFFNEMLNSLYATEIAVLEKPQFFKLYREFKETMIDFNHYGLKPYIHGFTYCKVLNFNENQVVLFDETIKVFYYIGDKRLRYPIFEDSTPTESQIKDIGNYIADHDEEGLYAYLVENKLASKRFIKRFNRHKRKAEKLEERKRKRENK